jgi:hypothetical protein
MAVVRQHMPDARCVIVGALDAEPDYVAAVLAEVGALGLGVMAGAVSLPHDGSGETLFTLVGVGLLALGHDLNQRAAR